MKQDPVRKMYANLSPHDLARVAFGHLMAGNESEVQKVIDCVPYKNYRCKDLEFQDKFEAYKTMAFLWAIEYWQVYAMHLESIIDGMSADGEKGKVFSDSGRIKQQIASSTSLSSLDRALESVCRTEGIDHMGVREMAGIRSQSMGAVDGGYERALISDLGAIVS